LTWNCSGPAAASEKRATHAGAPRAEARTQAASAAAQEAAVGEAAASERAAARRADERAAEGGMVGDEVAGRGERREGSPGRARREIRRG